jgi:hypothetical protein
MFEGERNSFDPKIYFPKMIESGTASVGPFASNPNQRAELALLPDTTRARHSSRQAGGRLTLGR